MATQTTNYNLSKPATTDLIDVSVLNDNFDAIDAQMKANADAAEAAAEALPDPATLQRAGIVKPDGTTITVDQDGTIHGANTYVLPPATTNTLGGIKVGENLTMSDNGRLNAYASVQTDAAPTQNSTKVPLSGGTYTMISQYAAQAAALATAVQAINTGLNWLDAVATYNDIAATYTTPASGDTVACLDTGYVWYYNGTAWINIFSVSFSPALTAAEVQEIWET